LTETKSQPAFVTGGTGFTGGHLIRHLLERGHDVTALVRPGRDGANLVRAGARVVHGDVRDRQSLLEGMPREATVFHIAAAWQEANVPDHVYRDVNVTGARNMIEVAHERGARRFVHCSTIGVHGDTGSSPANEDSPFAPPDLYCESKVEGELLARELFESLGLDGVVFRPLGIHGPGDRRFLKLFKSLADRRFVMIGDGETLYHMTYIDDLCRGILLCGEHPAAVGDVFILAGARHTTLTELVAEVAKAVGAPAPRWHVPLAPVMAAAYVCDVVFRPLGIQPPLYPRRVQFFSKDRAVDITKARTVLGYEPQVSLSEGLRRTADWYREVGWI
jgi:nucleoside-diphosphate-sugar epimerase